MLVLLLLAAGCSAGDDGSAPSSETAETPEEPRGLPVERISSNAPGQGPRRPSVILAHSASTLSRGLGAEIPDSGRGTYLISYWGEKPTGGYSLTVESARLRGNRITVRLALEEPPPDAILTQALTYPYVVAVVRDVDPQKDFSFVDQNRRELGWPVRRVEG
jgi:protease stability complex PrcB-like protein